MVSEGKERRKAVGGGYRSVEGRWLGRVGLVRLVRFGHDLWYIPLPIW